MSCRFPVRRLRGAEFGGLDFAWQAVCYHHVAFTKKGETHESLASSKLANLWRKISGVPTWKPEYEVPPAASRKLWILELQLHFDHHDCTKTKSCCYA